MRHITMNLEDSQWAEWLEAWVAERPLTDVEHEVYCSAYEQLYVAPQRESSRRVTVGLPDEGWAVWLDAQATLGLEGQLTDLEARVFCSVYEQVSNVLALI